MSAWVRGWVAGLVAVALVAAAAGPAVADDGRRCAPGELCLWDRPGYRGNVHRVSLANTNPDECVALPAEFTARSFANRMSRLVTVYQSGECATEGEFDTYPGGGTYVPEAPYVVRALQIWSG